MIQCSTGVNSKKIPFKPNQTCCCNVFLLSETLQRGMAEKSYHCPSCAKRVIWKTTKFVTQEKNPLKVNNDKGFGRVYDLTTHMSIHLNIKQYKCNICEKGFGQKMIWKNIASYL